MNGSERRALICKKLETSTVPLSGTELASVFHVSRQVIVQDIALLRAENKNILSTNKGYLLFHPGDPEQQAKRVILVKHTDAQVLEEFYTIVDLGGKVLDVSVEHELYGQIVVNLVINNRQDAEEFAARLEESKAATLKELTEGYHYHTIGAPNGEILDRIEQGLRDKGFCE